MKNVRRALAIAGLLGMASHAAIEFAVVGDGTGYDILGTADNEAAAYRSTGVPKRFDADDDQVYGTEGVFMFGDGGATAYNRPFAKHTQVGAPWASFAPGADFSSVAQSSHGQGPMDDPTAPIGAAVADWGSVGSAVTTGGGIGASREILRFTLSAGAPRQFRLGLVGGTQDQQNGRWDPTSYTLSGGSAVATVAGLENNTAGFGNFVFFDVALNDATNTTFTISGTQRRTTHGASLTGVTFDPLPVFVPKATAQRGRAGPPNQSNSLELMVARGFAKNFRKHEARLETIGKELETLPHPYQQEPTGTGGFLSHGLNSSNSVATITFRWKDPVALDAIALFPLRLFMDEIYGENLYWPGTIVVEAEIDGQNQTIARCAAGQPLIPQSLPNLIEFPPVLTRKLTLRCTDLPQHPYEMWHAAGFAEICIFSGSDNVAPRAVCKTSSSRQGYHVLAQEFLTDAQTPLGLPQLSSRSKSHPFIKKGRLGNKVIPGSYTLTCTYPREIPIDTVRIDPAIEHSYGQNFPVRFAIELLDAHGRVVQSDTTYQSFPLRKPGLNPYFAYFPETTAQAVRLTVYEASQPVPKAVPGIAFSEIAALHKGEEAARATAFEEQFLGKKLRAAPGDPPDTEAMRLLAPANDGLTHSGQVLPLRQWVVGLVRRQQLMEEQLILQNLQKKTLTDIGKILVHGSLTLLFLVIGGAAYLIVRNRIRMRKELRSTRARIASDLHDDVGSNLGTIILHVEKLQEQTDTPPDQKRLEAIYRLTRESVFGLREVLSTTAPEVGRTQNIVAYMQELAGLILGKTTYTFESGPAMSEALLEHSLRKGILLFYKEALYNAKRHSGCSHIDISLRLREREIVLWIKDKGSGMDEAVLARPRTLRTLKQRAEWLHANLQIQSNPGRGTELTLIIPQE
ncbi:sensor histidine kinase [Pontiella sp.]|uniref:sensor histidine kinase n=1 Tax=Pontiella sp. TaxID=2837462 RepID=UPI0035691D2A